MEEYDIVLAGDFASAGDIGARVAAECAVQWDMGMRTGLLHLPASPNRRIVADVHRCVRERIAEIVTLDLPVSVRLLVVHAPTALASLPISFVNLRADRVVLVHECAPDAETLGRLVGFARAPISWAPTNRWVRAAIDSLGLPIEIEDVDWRPPVTGYRRRPRAAADRKRFIIGHIDFGGRSHWPDSAEALAAVLPSDGSVDVRLLGLPPAALLLGEKMPEAWLVRELGAMTIEAFLDGLDALVYAPVKMPETVPDAVLGLALAKGCVVATLPHLRPHLGDGPSYAECRDLLSTAVSTLERPDLPDVLERAAKSASFQFSWRFHVERVTRLAGLHAPAAPKPASRPVPRTRRILFLASNGVGLGHVSRLLAIANRAAGRFEPIFVSHAQALPLLRGSAHPSEYLPSLSDTGADPRLWDRWLRSELERLIFAYEAEAVVFDGNNPYPGIIEAAQAQPPCKLVWVRRGMNGFIASPYLANARHFDLIIEPGEIAAERDAGATAAFRHEALQVDPVTLLDPSDLLDREEAIRVLGLDPVRPAVLVHLGAGAHRDVVSLVDSVVKCLRAFDGLQIVIAEWANASAPLSLWPYTTVVSAYPLSRYLRAFDFCISAAGYNSFHEAIVFGVPTVFIATTHRAVDDQKGRAGYAQDRGAALELPEDQLFHLPAICSVMLDPRARAVIQQKCGLLARPNGAERAASAIAELLRAA
ncbi:glycosyltransferase [Aquibium sp. ELW1220]|uniref:glycosyltransferase n=1 Tax=Aquibium sp. ELW1220 TaxID=2976766 RepID=UPI0025B15342|nr:glycosyltransferase [Aquibium sp. ELW1220]MDN2584328.1 hypothetical protein [Aquibium sp. ELW1220]